MADDPIVTLIVTPRERFSYAKRSLESIYEHFDIPFRLIYVDGGSPRSIQRYLTAQAQKKGFQLIRADRYLSPNQARNLGLQQASTKYVVFIDNDVMVAPGWLGPLVQCAEETNAAIVGPLLCQGLPLHTTVHASGGSCEIFTETENGKSVRRIYDKMTSQHQKASEFRKVSPRQRTQLAEFHCMLVRRDVFKETGPLDERMLSTREHIDLCLTVAQAGGDIYCESASIVTYLYGQDLRWSDIPFYFVRWNDAWARESLEYFVRKWRLEGDGYFRKHYGFVAQRRKRVVLHQLLRPVTQGRDIPWLEKVFVPLDKLLGSYIAHRYSRRFFAP